MPLQEKQRKQLQKLSQADGGGFYRFASNAHHAQMDAGKFLFLGLGGKGTKTVRDMKTDIGRRVDLEGDMDRPVNVEYLAIDTDRRELEAACLSGVDGVGLDYHTECVQLFSANAAAALETGTIPTYISEWMNPRLHAHLDGRGANGIRQASRFLLSFEDGFGQVRNVLESKLRHLSGVRLAGDPAEDQIIVYLFAGLCGGTGSGIFIDIAYIIRWLCERMGYRVKIEAYLYLADSYPTDAYFPSMQSNAYAALKELDVYQILADQENGYFDVEYPGVRIHSRNNAFDTCTLVSGSLQGGGQQLDPDRFSRQVVVEFVSNLTTRSQVGDAFLFSQFLDNDFVMIADAVNAVPEEIAPRDAMYLYNAVGLASLTLPVEQIMSYMARNAYVTLRARMEHHPTTAQVERLLQTLRIYPSVMSMDILSARGVEPLRYQRGMLTVTREEVLNGSAAARVRQLWMQRNIMLSQALDAACNEVLQQRLRWFNDAILQMCSDADRGLFYVPEFLGHEAENDGDLNGFLHWMRGEVLGETEGLIAGARADQQQIRENMHRIEHELGRGSFLGLGYASRIEHYLEQCVEYQLRETQIDIYLRIQAKLREFITYVENCLSVYQAYVESFLAFCDVLEQNYDITMQGLAQTDVYRVQLLDLSHQDEATRRFRAYLDGLLEGANYHQMALDLVVKIDKCKDLLLARDEGYNPMQLFTEFIEDQFPDIRRMSVQQVLEIQYGTADFHHGIQSIYQRLKACARPLYHPVGTFPLSSMAHKEYISVPQGAAALVSEILSCAAQDQVSVALSSDSNAIVWYSMTMGVPLFSLDMIMDYERVYQHPAVKSGMHLSETPTRDWRRFPPLFKHQMWKTFGYTNPEEQRIIDEVNANTETMLRQGIITLSPSGGGTPEYIGRRLIREVGDEEITAFLTAYCANPENLEAGRPRGGAALYDAFCQAVGCQSVEIYPVSVFGVPHNEEGLKRMLRLNWQAYLVLCKELDKGIFGCLTDRLASKTRITTFNELLVSGRIRQDDSGYYVYDSAGGRELDLLDPERLNELDRSYAHYHLFQRFLSLIDDEELDDVAESVEAVLSSRTDRTEVRGRRESCKNLCREAIGQLNRAKTQRAFAAVGQESLYDEVVEFYTAWGRLN